MEILKELEYMIFHKHSVSSKKFEYVANNKPLLLVAYNGDTAIGFKLGYKIPGSKIFFSWLGGVHEDYRQQGIAQCLLDRQEEHATSEGMERIYFTTFERFPAMIQLGKKNAYELVKSELDGEELKSWYEKPLKAITREGRTCLLLLKFVLFHV